MIELFTEFERIVGVFNRHRVPYAVIGGVALAAYGHPRMTKDIDFLVKSADVKRIDAMLDTIEIYASAQPWTFASTNLTLHRFMKIEGTETLTIDILACVEDNYLSVLRRANREKWKTFTVRVARREDLIWMKRIRNSAQDQADIERLSNVKV